MRTPNLTVIVSSIVGAFAVYGAVAACGSSSSPLPGGGTSGTTTTLSPVRDAAAQTSPCAKWQVMIVDAKKAASIESAADIYGKALDVPAGWEPIGTWGIDIVARRCAN